MYSRNFHTIAFTGGGNRCWWQAGFVSALQRMDWEMPQSVIACSAGAGVAAALITETTHEALSACKKLYNENPNIVHWSRRPYLSKPRFAQDDIYPKWLRAFLGATELLKLQQSSFKVSVAKLDNQRRKHWTVLAAACRYLMNRDNVKWPETQPLPRELAGLTADFLDLSECENLPQALRCLEATAAAAPFVSGREYKGETYFDGGYLCSSPSFLNASSKEPKGCLTLLTRHHSDRPLAFTYFGGTYVQPSRPIPVATWGCTGATDVDAAFRLGEEDGAKYANGSGRH